LYIFEENFKKKIRSKFSPKNVGEKNEFSTEKVLKIHFSKKFRGKKCTDPIRSQDHPASAGVGRQHRHEEPLGRGSHQPHSSRHHGEVLGRVLHPGTDFMKPDSGRKVLGQIFYSLILNMFS
jgi:hypothetical protein